MRLYYKEHPVNAAEGNKIRLAYPKASTPTKFSKPFAGRLSWPPG
jgi:hypothetical protein